MINPDKHLRAAYIAALESATGLKVYDNSVPMDESLPDRYIIFSNQRKDPFSRDKERYEWLCVPEIDIYSVNEKGFNSSAIIDDIEQQVLTAIGSGITIGAGFTNKFSRLSDTYTFNPVETETNTISRKRIIYEHWLNYVTS